MVLVDTPEDKEAFEEFGVEVAIAVYSESNKMMQNYAKFPSVEELNKIGDLIALNVLERVEELTKDLSKDMLLRYLTMFASGLMTNRMVNEESLRSKVQMLSLLRSLEQSDE